jgi:hypothetical protein
MEFKKLLILLSITITVMFGLTLGATYSWYAYSNAESFIGASTIDEAPTVVFAQTEYIASTKIMPIYDEDRYRYATKNSFTITLGENLQEYDTGLEIILNNINISEELKIENYKYELQQDKQTIISGNFSNIGDNQTIKLFPMTLMEPSTYPTTYVYELYIWLSEDGTDQNYLMNKNFGAQITVNSAVKK